MGKIGAVIFDMDGILFDTERISFGFWKKVLRRYGYSMSEELYISLTGRNNETINKILIKKYGQDMPIEKIHNEKHMEMVDFINENGLMLKPGVHELLDFLAESSYKVALATSANRERTFQLLEMAGIKNKFGTIVCGNDVVNSKPNPEIFLKAAKRLEVNPKRCIVLEDSPAGIEAAFNGGMMGINIPDLKELDCETKKFAYKIFNNLLEVRDYLSKDTIL